MAGPFRNGRDPRRHLTKLEKNGPYRNGRDPRQKEREGLPQMAEIPISDRGGQGKKGLTAMAGIPDKKRKCKSLAKSGAGFRRREGTGALPQWQGSLSPLRGTVRSGIAIRIPIRLVFVFAFIFTLALTLAGICFRV